MFFSFFAYSSKLVDMQKLVDSLRGYLEIVFFQLIFYFLNVFCQFLTDFGLFSLIYSSLTSIWVRAAPRSWLKYTTRGYMENSK